MIGLMPEFYFGRAPPYQSTDLVKYDTLKCLHYIIQFLIFTFLRYSSFSLQLKDNILFKDLFYFAQWDNPSKVKIYYVS